MNQRLRARCVLAAVVLVLLGVACKQSAEPAVTKPTPKPKLDVRLEFESELTRRRMAFTRMEDGRYEVKAPGAEAAGFTLTVSVENLVRDVERDGDVAAVSRFVDRFEHAQPAQRVLSWDEVRPLLRLTIEPNDYDERTMAEALQRPASRQTMLVLAYSDASGRHVRWVTPEDLQRWGVSRSDAEVAALAGLDSLLVGKKPEVKTVKGMKVGMIPVEGAYKASVIFAPSFRKFVEPAMGWPVLAVTPRRDFVYVFSNDGFDMVEQASPVVLREFTSSGYPVTTEVWRISDAGVEAIGTLAR